VSSTGELAVIVDPSPSGHRIFAGTLARMTMDGAVRPWMQHVADADWSPDGSTLAVLRTDNAGEQLEYPIDRVLYSVASGYLSDLRVSPDGARVAFFEHQIPSDDRGWVKAVDAKGNVTTLAGEYWGEEGLAWSTDSRFVYFSASSRGGEEFQPLVVNVTGAPAVHQALASAGAMYVQDVSREGRLLVMRDDMRVAVRARVPGEPAERDLAWLDYQYQGYLSQDRKFLVFGDESQSAGPNYAVALRALDSSEVVRLGEGLALPLSPDGKWAPALVPTTDQMVLYPTGPGDVVKLPKGALAHYRSSLQWFPDGRRVLVCGTASGEPPRCYAQDIPNGIPVPVTPANTIGALLASDGRTLLLRTTAGTYELAAIGSRTPPVQAKGFTHDDIPFAWTSDGRGIVVAAAVHVPAQIENVDPVTGQRTPIMTMAPPDLAGVTVVVPSQWIEDGKGYVYTYFRELSKLFVASGVRP
jgi:dipeptidyl aminopeptidase/acylaminoacyl peptidase